MDLPSDPWVGLLVNHRRFAILSPPVLELDVPTPFAKSNIACVAEMQGLVYGLLLWLASFTADVEIIDIELFFPGQGNW
jgi:hypothetical protein